MSMRMLFLLLACCPACGCGGGGAFGPATPVIAQVRGKVVFKGQPVSGVLVTFIPAKVKGQPDLQSGIGRADMNGDFLIRLQDLDDGMTTGKSEITVAPINPAATLPGVLPAGYQLEVKPGQNEFTIELQPQGTGP